MNLYEYQKMKEVNELIENNIEELNIIRNRIKRSLNDLKRSQFSKKTEQLERLLHDNDIKIMTLILLQEKVKKIMH
ncbi:hypothetical protein [Bacillus sp. FJAT-49736]|uniref:hypothetical protein n=1 Tax=Bacillus sp. FJAT-49736 TaxID=2833582 RepID=UPI001BC8CF62|nr:hypothetical protein [Bacillus sp. FJAT-49736]MBS4173161.1 hypothetical protein [Bacillus sp. FJAT-49736]